MKYDHKKIEKKWAKEWDKTGIYTAQDKSEKPKYYALVEFPYPSGVGLHVGHIRSNTAMDIIARKRRMEGYNVLYPMGWDAFGLPTENYAIKTGIAPQVATKKNTTTFKKQLKAMGFSFDWTREIDTTDPKYYKWTQWMFLQFFKHGLAYKAKAEINWCPKDKIGLANEEVENGKCERCGGPVEKRQKEQWMLKMSSYSEKLLSGLKGLDFIPEVSTSQENWIGKSEGAEIEFRISNSEFRIKVFTTRADTILGATYMVVAPEHGLIDELKSKITNWSEIESYRQSASRKNDIERTAENKEKTGVELNGIKAINPATKEEIPVWISDYVLAGYGTGAIMAVPALDDRDRAFAEKFKLPIVEKPLVSFEQALKMTGGVKKVTYKLRDWVFSRQRYWGEPIPLVHCDTCAKKPKILLIHGLHGSPQENWFPWFKTMLEARRYEVIVPHLPTSEHFKIEDWLAPLSKLGIKQGDRISVVGHSLAGPTACQFIIRNKLKVENLVLVAPTGASQGAENWKNLRAKGVSLENITTIQEFNDANKHLDKAVKLAKRRVIYLSDNDPYIPVAVEGDYKPLKAEVKLLKNKGHFNASAGILEFPEILNEFPNVESAGWIPVPDDKLPVKLPKVQKYQPTDNGESPLSKVEKWVSVKCPNCGGTARRETDTMPNWAGSSWYFLRYLDPHNDKQFASKEKMEYWLGVDWYNGGMEHATRHLLYARFWNQFFHDIGEVPVSEPFKKRTAHGMILGADGVKMSKSVGNVVNPEELINEFGADALRMYEMFIGPFDQMVAWDPRGILGPSRFLERVWRISSENANQDNNPNVELHFQKIIHKTIKKVSEDIEKMSFNTAVSAMMVFINEISSSEFRISKEDWGSFLKLLAPFAPFMAEELWQQHIQNSKFKIQNSIHLAPWPKYDPKLLVEESFDMVVQINGRTRTKISASMGISEAEATKLVLANEELKKWVAGEPKKVIFVPNRLINLIF